MPTGSRIFNVCTFISVPNSENASANDCTKKLKYLKKNRMPMFSTIAPMFIHLRYFSSTVLPIHHPAKKVEKAVSSSSPRNRQSHHP